MATKYKILSGFIYKLNIILSGVPQNFHVFFIDEFPIEWQKQVFTYYQLMDICMVSNS
jgi:hypothetical protein